MKSKYAEITKDYRMPPLIVTDKDISDTIGERQKMLKKRNLMEKILVWIIVALILLIGALQWINYNRTIGEKRMAEIHRAITLNTYRHK